MTQAVIKVRGGAAHVRLDGHAGDPLVCAAISAMCCAVINALGQLAQDVVYESGGVRFSADLADERARGALDVLIFGLNGLQEKFPGRVGVTWADDAVIR